MEKWLRNFTFLSFLGAVIVVAGISDAFDARFDHGHRFGADMTLISSLNLSAEENANLVSALSTDRPDSPAASVKTAMQAFHAAKKKLNADLQAAAPDGNQLAADAQALSAAKTQLKSARANLNGALKAALTSEHLQQLQATLTEQFQNRMDSKTGRILFGYAFSLKRQSQQTMSTVSSGTGEAQ